MSDAGDIKCDLYEEILGKIDLHGIKVMRIPSELRDLDAPADGKWFMVTQTGQLMLGVGREPDSPNYWSTCCTCVRDHNCIPRLKETLVRIGFKGYR